VGNFCLTWPSILVLLFILLLYLHLFIQKDSLISVPIFNYFFLAGLAVSFESYVPTMGSFFLKPFVKNLFLSCKYLVRLDMMGIIFVIVFMFFRFLRLIMMTRRVHYFFFSGRFICSIFFFYYFFFFFKRWAGFWNGTEKGWFLVLSTSRVFENRIENRNQSNQREKFFPRILVAFLLGTTCGWMKVEYWPVFWPGRWICALHGNRYFGSWVSWRILVAAWPELESRNRSGL
jgi:hypothetical protein